MFTVRAIKDTDLWIMHELGKTIPDIARNVLYDKPELAGIIQEHVDDPKLKSGVENIMRAVKVQLEDSTSKLDAYDLFVNMVNKLGDFFSEYAQGRGGGARA